MGKSAATWIRKIWKIQTTKSGNRDYPKRLEHWTCESGTLAFSYASTKMSEHVQTIPPFIESRQALVARRVARPTAREWAVNTFGSIFSYIFDNDVRREYFWPRPADLPVSEPVLSGRI